MAVGASGCTTVLGTNGPSLAKFDICPRPARNAKPTVRLIGTELQNSNGPAKIRCELSKRANYELPPDGCNRICRRPPRRLSSSKWRFGQLPCAAAKYDSRYPCRVPSLGPQRGAPI